MRQHITIFLYALVLILAGCSTVQPQTFDQRLAVSLGQVTATRLITADLVERGRLTSEEGWQILELTDNARMLIEQARILRQFDDTDALARLRMAQNILLSLEKYLSEKR